MKEITQSCPLVHKPNFITIQTVSWQCLSAQNKRTSHRMGEYLIKELTKIHKTPKAQHNKRLKNGPETLTDTSKRMHRWPISQWKHEPGKKKKKKYQYTPCSHENGQKPRTHWQHQMLVRMRSNRNSHSLLAGIQSGAASWEDRLSVQHSFTIQSSN